ncbi:hypothetical protein BH24BAC1_BH24BAC1_23780 [soil metagenome]
MGDKEKWKNRSEEQCYLTSDDRDYQGKPSAIDRR